MNRLQWKECWRKQRLIKSEEWKPVVWYEWLYEVSNLWNIKSIDRYVFWRKQKWIVRKINIDTNWYNSIILAKDKKYLRIRFHRLVAQTFIPNPENKSDVNHIDWNKNNNSVYNLEWNTKSENHIHSRRILKHKTLFQTNHPSKWKFWKNNPKSKPVNQYDLNWNFIKEWGWQMEAWRSLWISNANISACCRWLKNTCWWFIWKF